MTATIAIMDANGVLGREVLAVLEEQDTPWMRELRLFSASGDTSVRFRGKDLEIRAPRDEAFRGVDIAVLGRDREYGWGAVTVNVADNAEAKVVLAALDADAIEEHEGRVAIPDGVGIAISRLVCGVGDVTTARAFAMQPAALLGPRAIEELYEQTMALFKHAPVPISVLPGRLAFNVLPGTPQYGAAQLCDCPITSSSFLVPLFGGTVVVLDLTCSATTEEVEQRLQALEGIDVWSELPEPADVVGDSDIRVMVESTPEGVRITATLDEVRVAADALLAAARELAEREAF